MIKIKVFHTIVIAFFILCYNYSHAYQGIVHYRINEESAKNASRLDSFLKYQLGIQAGIDGIIQNHNENQRIWQWLSFGGEAEDFGKSNVFLFKDLNSRAYNHFHDPLKNWSSAGLDNNRINTIYNNHYGREPVSAILWSFEPGEQDFPENSTGEWSWGKAREYYYAHLTGKDFHDCYIATDQKEREAILADCFRSIGQVMHLLEDMSVPLHTRNDAHILPLIGLGRWTYETFTAKYWRFLDYSPDQPGDFPSSSILTDPQPDSEYAELVPVTGFFDRNQYEQGHSIPTNGSNIGLSEYANSNFLTNDTLWTYQHPALEETNYDQKIWLNPEVVDAEDGWQDYRIYFGKNAGEPVHHLMAAGYWYYQLFMCNRPELQYAFIVDEVCFAEYAEKLIPRAVGYSAALLDYFFRGTIEIALPADEYHSGAYSMVIDPDQGFSRIVLDARNTTRDGEQMTDGSIELVVKYKTALEDPFQNYPVPTSDEFSYIVASEANSISALPREDFVQLTFDLVHPLPIDATDVSLFVVYRGQLGSEADAVAVGFKDVSEPTPIDIMNNMDKVCLSETWLDAGSDEAIALADTNGNGAIDDLELDVFPHDLMDIYLRVTSIDNPQYPSQTEEDIHIPELHTGEFHRAFYILTENEYTLSSNEIKAVPVPPSNQGTIGYVGAERHTWTGIKNQTDAGTQEECLALGDKMPCTIRNFPTFKIVRGFETRDLLAIIFDDESWGNDPTCSIEDPVLNP